LREQFEVWIGLVEVAPLPGSATLDKKAFGAYTNFLVWANCREEFCRVVDQCLTTLELRFVEAEDVEPLCGKPKFFAARARLMGDQSRSFPGANCDPN